MKKFNASQLYPFHPTSELLAAFLALPGPVGAAFALAWWEEDGRKVDVALYALRGREGVEVDWEAVVGPPAADFARLLEAWMRDTREEERMEAWLSRGGGNAQLVYTALPRGELDRVEVVWVWSELPLTKREAARRIRRRIAEASEEEVAAMARFLGLDLLDPTWTEGFALPGYPPLKERRGHLAANLVDAVYVESPPGESYRPVEAGSPESVLAGLLVLGKPVPHVE